MKSRFFYVPLQAKPTIMQHTNTPNTDELDINRVLIANASMPYEKKMLQLVGGDEARRSELAGKLLSGIEKPSLMMYHVDVLHSHDGHRAYEFLIEYCTNDPSVGVYYGCRGFTKKQYSHPKEIQQFIKEYEALKDELIQKLNRRFLGKDFTYRLLPTDNTDSKTYWLFWIQLQPDEDIREVALPATILIRDIFAKYLGMEVATTPPAGQSAASPYDLLLRECSTYAYDHAQLFESIIRHLEADGIFVREADEEHVWRFMGAPKHSTNADFSRLIHLIFSEFIHPSKSQTEDNAKLVPWRLVRSIFLDKHGNAFKDSVRTQWQYEGTTDAKTDFWRNKIASLLDTQ